MPARRLCNGLAKAMVAVAAAGGTLVVLVLVLTFVSGPSEANRQFQRETGRPCGFCHVAGNEPQLNSAGRRYQACGYRFCDGGQREPRREPSQNRGGACQPGFITCAAYCDRYDPRPHACKFTAPRSCMAKYGNVHRCIQDR
jgi:hypothetical protein